MLGKRLSLCKKLFKYDCALLAVLFLVNLPILAADAQQFSLEELNEIKEILSEEGPTTKIAVLNEVATEDDEQPSKNLCSKEDLGKACFILEGCYISNKDNPKVPGDTARQLIGFCEDKIKCLIRKRIKENCTLDFDVYVEADDDGTSTGLYCNNRDITGVGVRGPSQGHVTVPSKDECSEAKKR